MDDIARIQACITNRLDAASIGNKGIAGVIGDSPSRYSKSPDLWNAAFRAMGIDARYLALDVDELHLPELLSAIRQSDRVLGASVTVPHKVGIMDHLDEIDEKAKRVGAVNTLARTEDGRLVGYNTDGEGFLDCILAPPPGSERPFMDSLKDMDVLLIGAGGAGKAVAFALAECLGSGQLLICNRTPKAARSLVEEVKGLQRNVRAIGEEEIGNWAPKAGLILNSSTKGQGEIRKTADGKITILEPYSALAPANPALLPASEYGKPESYRACLSASLTDIEGNNRRSWELALTIPPNVGFCDLIYFPAETVFLRHGRLTGHRTLNGRGMIVAQAAAAFFNMVCRGELEKRGLRNPETYRRIGEVMWQAWK